MSKKYCPVSSSKTGFVVQAVVIFALCACSSKNDTGGLVHPDPAQMPAAEEISHVIDLKDSDGLLESSKIGFDTNPVLVEIGEEDGENDYFIYNLRLFRVDDRGNMYLTKGEETTIHVFDSRGKHQYSIGRSGRGPGEFNRIWSFDFDTSHDNLYVLDYNKIEVFSLQDGVYEYKHTIDHRLAFVYDLCALDDYVYVSGFYLEELDEDRHVQRPWGTKTNSRPVHRFGISSDTLLSSFGPSYTSYSHNPLWGGELSKMMLNCNRQTGTVSALQMNFGYVYGYDGYGRQKWLSRIDGLDLQVFTEENIMKPNERMRSSREDVIFTPNFRGFRETDSEFAVLQINYSVAASRRPGLGTLIRMHFSNRPVFHSVYIDTRTGEMHFTQLYMKDREQTRDEGVFLTNKAGHVYRVVHRESGVNDYQLVRVFGGGD